MITIREVHCPGVAYRLMLFDISKTTGDELNYAEICQVAPNFVRMMRELVCWPIGLPGDKARSEPR